MIVQPKPCLDRGHVRDPGVQSLAIHNKRQAIIPLRPGDTQLLARPPAEDKVELPLPSRAGARRPLRAHVGWTQRGA